TIASGTSVPATACKAACTVPSPPTATRAVAPSATACRQACSASAADVAGSTCGEVPAIANRSSTTGKSRRCRRPPAPGLASTTTRWPVEGFVTPGPYRIISGRGAQVPGRRILDQIVVPAGVGGGTGRRRLRRPPRGAARLRHALRQGGVDTRPGDVRIQLLIQRGGGVRQRGGLVVRQLRQRIPAAGPAPVVEERGPHRQEVQQAQAQRQQNHPERP